MRERERVKQVNRSQIMLSKIQERDKCIELNQKAIELQREQYNQAKREISAKVLSNQQLLKLKAYCENKALLRKHQSILQNSIKKNNISSQLNKIMWEESNSLQQKLLDVSK